MNVFAYLMKDSELLLSANGFQTFAREKFLASSKKVLLFWILFSWTVSLIRDSLSLHR